MHRRLFMFRDVMRILLSGVGLLWASYAAHAGMIYGVEQLSAHHAALSSAPLISNNASSWHSRPELSILLGGSYIPNTMNNQKLQLLPYEIGDYADTFTNQSDAGAFSWGVDALYRFKLNGLLGSSGFIDSFAVGVNFAQITNFQQTGNVLQFGMPEFENYTYVLKLNNSRIMADMDVNFNPVARLIIPFVVGGVGAAQTTVSYNSVPIAPVESSNFTLSDETSWRFAYQAGAGIKYEVTPNVALSLRYLYANMGKVNSATVGNTALLDSPLMVNMSTHNALLGVTYAMA